MVFYAFVQEGIGHSSRVGKLKEAIEFIEDYFLEKKTHVAWNNGNILGYISQEAVCRRHDSGCQFNDDLKFL